MHQSSSVTKSGHTLTIKVEDFFRKAKYKWHLPQFLNFIDPISKINREIDVIAEYKIPISLKKDRNIKIRLLIECKHIAYDVDFWFQEKDIEIVRNRLFEDLSSYFDITNHHYYTEKLFSNKWDPNGKKDHIYDAVNKCLNALIYFKSISDNDSDVVFTINYPIVILNNFHKIFEYQGDNKFSLNANFQMGQNFGKDYYPL